MKNVYVVADNIISPLGATTNANLLNLEKNITGITEQHRPLMSDQSFYASLFEAESFQNIPDSYTKFEKLLIASISNACTFTDINVADRDTILIISSTKGNISLLETQEYNPMLADRIALHTSARLVADYFKSINRPVVISNACISGIVAILTGMRLLRSGQYTNAIIAGADVISKFVLSGFESFQAISNEPCRPFDEGRKGINLGEGAATIILSVNNESPLARITGGAVSNDANHISGPSRTGEELCFAMEKAIKDAAIAKEEIDFISAHGTATLYNDEMEAKAITLANLEASPVNSLKGFYGHTLGAAGIIESVIAVHSLKQGIVFPTKGFDKPGVSLPLNLSKNLRHMPLRNVLKTGSGFGGCNAAVVISSDQD